MGIIGLFTVILFPKKDKEPETTPEEKAQFVSDWISPFFTTVIYALGYLSPGCLVSTIIIRIRNNNIRRIKD